MKKRYPFYVFIFFFILCSNAGSSQTNPRADTAKFKFLAAGPEYKRSSFYQWLWGRNYRKEWITPVKFPILILDKIKGGLIVKSAGGGHQSKSLHLQTHNGQGYTLRTVDKTLTVLVPKIFHHTFIEDIANDEISPSHPYGALAVPLMAQSAGIPHTNPEFYYLPKQNALDTFNEKYGNRLYLFEQRPDGDWSSADNLGNFSKFIGSDDMLKKIYEDNDRRVDQKAFARARLFDMLIGDWDRHADQWKWGLIDSGKQKIYEPIPTDRDQAFFKFNGVLLKSAISAAGMKYLKSFDYTIRDVKTFGYERRILDRFLTNQLTVNDWQAAAKSLQQSISDNAIETSIKQMPQEIFAISGNEIIAKLKSRLTHLDEYAREYYLFLAKEVEIVGSKQNEYFEINRNEDATSVNVSKINNGGKTKEHPFYSRTFKTNETREIRLYGLSGKDVYTVSGSSKIRLRIIGGDDRDSIINTSGGKRTHVYDDAGNDFKVTNTKLHLSKDSAIHIFDFDDFFPDKRGIAPAAGYNEEDRLYVGIGYHFLHHKWRKLPFASKQDLNVHYSISQKAFSVNYKGLFHEAVGKWDLGLKANYDAVRWTYFHGIGNETPLLDKKRIFYQMRTKEWFGSIGINRKIGRSTFDISGFFNNVKIIKDSARFVVKTFNPANPDIFKSNSYAGIQVGYNVAHLNDSIVPTSGITFFANASHTQNINHSDRSFQNFSGVVQFFVPLISKFSLAIKTGGATIVGTPEFYQYVSIGGAKNLRGFDRDRFWGKTSFYNNNELRFITNIRSYIFNGQVGLLAFLDDGRVWIPSETSNSWHYGYGGGLLVAPFHLLSAQVTYGISKESEYFQLQLNKYF
jgi:Haemolysin secretion/activation protein ShlB/FhaC/HecB